MKKACTPSDADAAAFYDARERAALGVAERVLCLSTRDQASLEKLLSSAAAGNGGSAAAQQQQQQQQRPAAAQPQPRVSVLLPCLRGDLALGTPPITAH